MDEVRAALQRLCDDEGDGWQVAHVVTVCGLYRVDANGRLEWSDPWVATPDDQPDYVTDALIDRAALSGVSSLLDDDY